MKSPQSNTPDDVRASIDICNSRKWSLPTSKKDFLEFRNKQWIPLATHEKIVSEFGINWYKKYNELKSEHEKIINGFRQMVEVRDLEIDTLNQQIIYLKAERDSLLKSYSEHESCIYKQKVHLKPYPWRDRQFLKQG